MEKVRACDRFIKYLLFFLLCLVILCFFIHKMINIDIWWHLKAGEHILQNHQIPKNNMFSYTQPEYPWIDLHWGFQTIAYLFYKKMGANGLILLKIIVLSTTLLLLGKINYSKKTYLVTIAIFIFAIISANERLLIRPELFSFLFLSIYLYTLHKYKYGQKNLLIYFLPFIQIIWVNVHGVFILGPVVIFIYLAGELISWKVKLPFEWNSKYTLKEKRYNRMLIIGLLTILACFVNPYGWRGVLFPFTLFKHILGQDILSNTVIECKPLLKNFNSFGVISAKIMTFFCLLTFLSNIKKLTITHLLLYIAFLFLVLKSVRNIALFTFVATPIMIFNLNHFLVRLSKIQKKPMHVILKIANNLIIISCLIITLALIEGLVSNSYHVKNKDWREFGFGASKLIYPDDAINFIQKNELHGNMFNTWAPAGYFIWKCYPAKKVFIDSRGDTYSIDFLQEYFSALDHKEMWHKLNTKYKINYILVNHHYNINFINRVCNDENWKSVYWDKTSMIFIKNNIENTHIINKCTESFRNLKKVNLLINKKQKDASFLDMAVSGIQKFTGKRRNPYFNTRLAEIALFFDDYETAEQEYKKALKIDPNSKSVQKIYERLPEHLKKL